MPEEPATQEDHPNLTLLKQLDPANLAESKNVFAPDVVFHYFNPRLPDVQGDYVGLVGMRSFFEKIGRLTNGTFQVEPVSAKAIGDELVVMHTRNRMSLQGQAIAIDVVLVWRIVEGRITEVWDIPSVH